jgi:1,4-dihydroxy-6-naphthoate synthase
MQASLTSCLSALDDALALSDSYSFLEAAAAIEGQVAAQMSACMDPPPSIKAEVGLIIHEGQLTYANEGLVVCEDLGVWWGRENDGLPLPLGGNVIHRRHAPELRSRVSGILTGSIQFSLDHRDAAVAHSMQWARDMGQDLADRFVGMYVNHWTLDYGERGRESIRRFLARGQALGAFPKAPELEFVV